MVVERCVPCVLSTTEGFHRVIPVHDTTHLAPVQTDSQVLHADPHFIYITACRDESKEELQSYYKMTDEDMEQIMKEWPEEFQTPVVDVELSDADIIGSPLVTWFEHAGQSSVKKKKKKEEVQNIQTDEEDNAWKKVDLAHPQEEEEEKTK
jgi:hypothetical protein